MPASETPLKDPEGLTIEQIKLARELGPHMLEVLMGWRISEDTLASSGVGFRAKVKAASDLRGLYETGQAMVNRVLNLESDNNGG